MDTVISKASISWDVKIYMHIKISQYFEKANNFQDFDFSIVEMDYVRKTRRG